MVAPSTIRRALDAVLDAQANVMRDLTQRMIDGNLSLADWQLQMRGAIKSTHLVAASTAQGGWAQMSLSDFGWTGQRIRAQYRFVDGFARDIAAGRQPLTASAVNRASMYAEAGRATHRAAETRAAKQRGLDEERNVLGFADHCAGCLTETGKGWVAIGTLVPCGSRTCLARCHCSLAYRTVA